MRIYVKLSINIYLSDIYMFREVVIDTFFFDQYVQRNLCIRLIFLG